MPTVKHEPEFVHVDGHGACEVLVVPKLSSAVEHRHYTKESFTHPAKMSTMLCREIIRRYTRKGEFVLDPMAGISTTQIEAALLGRNAIGVELEEPFVKMSKKTIKLLEKLKTPAPKGKATIIQGDSRELSKILKGNVSNMPYGEADAIVTSPPYVKQIGRGIHPHLQGLISKLSGIPVKDFDNNPELHKKAVAIAQEKLMTQYSKSKENIANAPYGEIDAIITSPPYADTPLQDYATSNKALLRFEREVRGSFEEKGYFEFNGRRYTEREWRRINKGELKPRGMPELWKQIISQRRGSSYSEIARVDAIITSPPYEKSISKRGREEPRERIASRLKKAGFSEEYIKRYFTNNPSDNKMKGMGVADAYSANPKNIGNLPHGQVDAIVTSPPYAEQRKGKADPEKMAERWEKHRRKNWNSWGKSAHTPGRLRAFKAMGSGYSESKENIGNLPLGQVDAVITSPPYSEGTGHGGGKDDIIKEKHLYLHGKGSYSEGKENIGHLKHGQVDAIVTSPPYEGSLESTSRHTKGGIPERDKKLGQTGFYPSENKDNIGSKKGETYLSAMLKVYLECFKVLRPGGRMVLVLKNFIRNKEIQRLDLDTKRLCEAAGFRWVETKLFRLPRKSFWRVLYEQKYPEVDTSLLRYEFVEVFEKPLEAYA